MSVTEADIADLLGSVDEFIQRAIDDGFTRAEAIQLCKNLCPNEPDRMARERRSRFKVVR